MRRSRPVGPAARSGSLRELLLAVARGDADDGYLADLAGVVPAAELVEACRHHGVVSLVHERLRLIDGSNAPALHALAGPRIAYQLRHLGLEETQAVIGAALDVPWLTVKGAVLAQWYEVPSTRDFGDLDVLVHPSQFRRALESLLAVGLVPVSENWRGFSAHEVAEVPIANGTNIVDLHWHLVAMGRSRRHFHLPTDDLIDRAVTAHVGGRDVLTLDPADTLVHLCVNVGLDGARRLRGLIDVDTVLRSGCVDVEEFVERAGQARAGRLAAAVLQRSQRLLRTPLAPGLLRRLSPSRAWLLANSAVDRAGALRRRPTAGVSPGLLLGSGRDSVAATVESCGRSLWRMTTAALGRPALAEPGGELDWQRKPPPDRLEAHRREYLDWVGQQ